ncbi:MAG: hypothetical protein ACQEP8_05810 [Chlamydiota bacterium]
MEEIEDSIIQDFKKQITDLMLASDYQPLKRRHLIAALKIPSDQHIAFRRALKLLKKEHFLSIQHGDYILRPKNEAD